MDIRKLVRERGGIHLDVGCGKVKQPGFVGLDIIKWSGVDIVHDAESYPWPLPDECCLMILCSHIVEHINPHKGGFLKFMNECWRIMKPDGRLVIVAPYGLSMGYIQDPTHCNPVNEATWAYFDPLVFDKDGTRVGLYDIYEPKPWRIETNMYNKDGNMDVVLVKRRDDVSYHQGGLNET